jgi:hypothetical protein
MSLTLTHATKKATKAVNKVDDSEAILLANKDELTDEQLADLYGTLQDRAEAIRTNPVFVQLAEVSKLLLDRVDAAAEPSDTVELSGDHWVLEIGACSRNSADITSIQKVRDMLGEETFMKLAKITLTDLKKYLNPEQLDTVLETETGYKKGRKIVAKFKG